MGNRVEWCAFSIHIYLLRRKFKQFLNPKMQYNLLCCILNSNKVLTGG
jgi:hypothetical protein